jgi:hypothetical protein
MGRVINVPQNGLKKGVTNEEPAARGRKKGDKEKISISEHKRKVDN